jgi:cytochrome b
MTIIENASDTDNAPPEPEVKVWDIAIRLFHWSLVITFTLAWITAEDWDQAHEYAGYAVGGLVLFRILWGFVGAKYARFSDFVYSPAAVYRYLGDSLRHKAKRYLGHNPAGGAMVGAFIVMLLVATGTGILATMDGFRGVEWVEELHEGTSYVTLLMVVAHIVGVIHASVSHRENLVKSMVTGFKRRS